MNDATLNILAILGWTLGAAVTLFFVELIFRTVLKRYGTRQEGLQHRVATELPRMPHA